MRSREYGDWSKVGKQPRHAQDPVELAMTVACFVLAVPVLIFAYGTIFGWF